MPIVRSLVSVLGATLLAFVPVTALSQSQSFPTQVEVIGFQSAYGNQWTLTIDVPANGGIGYAPQNSTFSVDIYEDGSLYVGTCIGSIGVGGKGSCTFENPSPDASIDIYYDGGYDADGNYYEPSSFLNYWIA
jgi:hypothetical protein